jgi:hypothetical protein
MEVINEDLPCPKGAIKKNIPFAGSSRYLLISFPSLKFDIFKNYEE